MNTTNNIFSKAYQKELAEQYRQGLIPVWDKDKGMIDYCIKSTALFIPICNGKYILNIEKHHIEKHFWFGESDCGQGLSHCENVKHMNNVRENLIQYFMNQNTKGIDEKIKDLEDIYNNKSYYKVVHRPHYYSCPDDTNIHCIKFIDNFYDKKEDDDIELTKKDLALCIEAYKLYKEMVLKRLETYIKKYDLKHVGISSYWIDR